MNDGREQKHTTEVARPSALPTSPALRAARASFPALARCAYLNAGTAGPLARATVEAMASYNDLDLHNGRCSDEHWDEALALRNRLRSSIGALLGVSVDKIALTNSTTDGCRIVLAGLGLCERDEVVTTDCEHPGLLGPLKASGAHIRVAEIRDRPAADAYDAIKSEVGPRTRLLAISHVTWTTGQILPIRQLKMDLGIPMLVDGAQAAGAIPVVAEGIDFYTVSGQKWLCGPEATGALYVLESDDLRVSLPSVLSYSDSRSFAPQPNASRFDWGWHPRSALAGLIAALDARPSWAESQAAHAAAQCRQRLLEHGSRVHTEPDQATLVSFESEGDAAAVAATAREAGVLIRSLPGMNWLRASCGYWTNDEDIDRLCSVLPTS